MAEVSIVIVNYNGINLLGECLDSIRKQSYRDFEIILVDNASTDGSVEFVSTRYSECKIITNQYNRGYGGGNNDGIRIATGKYIAVLNNDTRVEPEWLERLVRVIESDGKIGMCASKIMNYYSPEIIDSTGLLIFWDGLARGRGRLERDAGQYDSATDVLCPSGCAALYRTEMLRQIGLFDEDFFLYLEDLDLGLRARVAGWRCMFVPDAIVYHRYSATVEPYSATKAYLVERNRLWILMKYFPVELIGASMGFTAMRYILQVYGMLKGRGAGSRFLSTHSPLKGIRILFSAYLSALSMSGRMLKKRRKIKEFTTLNRWGFYRLLRRYAIGLKEIALKD